MINMFIVLLALWPWVLDSCLANTDDGILYANKIKIAIFSPVEDRASRTVMASISI